MVLARLDGRDEQRVGPRLRQPGAGARGHRRRPEPGADRDWANRPGQRDPAFRRVARNIDSGRARNREQHVGLGQAGVEPASERLHQRAIAPFGMADRDEIIDQQQHLHPMLHPRAPQHGGIVGAEPRRAENGDHVARRYQVGERHQPAHPRRARHQRPRQPRQRRDRLNLRLHRRHLRPPDADRRHPDRHRQAIQQPPHPRPPRALHHPRRLAPHPPRRMADQPAEQRLDILPRHFAEGIARQIMTQEPDAIAPRQPPYRALQLERQPLDAARPAAARDVLEQILDVDPDAHGNLCPCRQSPLPGGRR